MGNKIKYINTITFGELFIAFVLIHIMFLMGFIGLAIVTTGWLGIIMLIVLAIFLTIISNKMAKGLRKIMGIKPSQNDRNKK